MPKTPLALAATLTLIFSALIAQAATLTQGTGPTAISLVLQNSSNTMNWVGTITAGQFAGEQVDFSSSQPVNVTSGNLISPVSTTASTNFTINSSSAVPAGCNSRTLLSDPVFR